MPRGYRLFVITLGLILAGAAPPKKEPVTQTAAHQVSPTQAPPADYSPYPDKQADSCYQAKDHDSADLCAQWRAAIAAEKASNAAWWGNLIGGVGAALSFASVILVIAALRQTERSLSAASAANEIARDTAKSQLRAYVMAEDQFMIGFYRNGPTEFTVKLHNRGQTPAHNVRVWSVVGGTTENPDDFKVFRRPEPGFHQSASVLGPGNFMLHSNDCQAPLSGDAYLSVVMGGVKFVFAGVISYDDIFGKSHKTTFKQFYIGNGNFKPTEGDLLACGRGNTSN